MFFLRQDYSGTIDPKVISDAPLISVPMQLLDWLDHGFGTRNSLLDQDRMASLQQIHSSLVLAASEPGCAGEGDALITNVPGRAISIRTADCFPILLADPDHRAIAAVHAGWRGSAARIVCRTIDSMRSEFGTRPGSVIAAIGPGIGPCCYTVGEDVARQFGRTAKQDGTLALDLAEINRAQLVQAGVPAGHIDTLHRCTKCEPMLFHSYRRDGERAGRMISYIALR
jgi:polyphenol oxidase